MNSEKEINIGPYTYKYQPISKRDGIRWAVGSQDGFRSSTWRLWGDIKGDVYLAGRQHGRELKVSIHRDGNCSFGFTNESGRSIENIDGMSSRHFVRWKLPAVPVAKVAEIIIPSSELACFKSDEKEPMRWLDIPAPNMMKIFWLYIAEPPSAFNWENPIKNGQMLATIQSNNRLAWLVHFDVDVHEDIAKCIGEFRNRISVIEALENESSEGIRMVMWAKKQENNEISFIEALPPISGIS